MSQIQIPKGWELKKLGDIFEPKNEKWLPNPRGDLINYVGLENIESNSGKLVDYQPTKTSLIKSSKTRFTNQDILYGKLRPYLNKVLLPDFEGVCSTDILVLRPKEMIEKKYLLYFLLSSFVLDHISKRTFGTKMPRTKIQELEKITIMYPQDKETQKKIVQKLDHILGQLEEKEKIIHNLRNNNKQLLEKLIQNKRGQRPSGFLSHISFKIFSDLMMLCENNTIDNHFETIEQCCAEIIDTPHSTVKYEVSGVPVIRTSDIYPEVIDFSNTKFTDEETYQVRKRKLDPKIGDVLYTREAPWGIAAVVKESKFVVGQRILLLRPDDSKIYGSFLSLFLNSLLGYEQALKVVNRTTSEHINIADIRKFKIPIIPKNEQLTILESMKTKNNELELINNKINDVITYQNSLLESLHTIKTSMLNSAFSGKLVN